MLQDSTWIPSLHVQQGLQSTIPLANRSSSRKAIHFSHQWFSTNGLPKIPTPQAVPRESSQVFHQAAECSCASLSFVSKRFKASSRCTASRCNSSWRPAGFFSHGATTKTTQIKNTQRHHVIVVHKRLNPTYDPFLGNPPKKTGFFDEPQTFRQCASNSRFQIQGRLTCHSAATFQCSLLTCKCLFQAYQFLAVDNENGGQELDICPKLVVFQGFPTTGVSFNCETTLLLQLIGSHLCLFG